MRRVYAVVICLAMFAMAAPGLATADPYATPAVRQQAINAVITHALAQRGVPFVYGGGNSSGPTVSTVPAEPAQPAQTASADSAVVPGTNGLQLANVPTAAPAVTAPAVTGPIAPASGVAGFDASGLVQYAFATVGIKLPRSSGEQYKVGRKIAPAQALPGDLMFYGPEGSQSVALFIGNGQMVEATNPVVTVSPVRTNGMTPYLARIIEW